MLNTSSKYLLLNNLDVLSSLSQEEKKDLSEVVEIKNFKKNEYIYQTNDEITKVCLVEKGAVFIGRLTNLNKPILKDIIYPNALFGENVFVPSNHRSDFAQALKESRVFLIPITHFEYLFKQNRAFSFQVTSSMINKLENLESRIQNFVFLKAKERIGSFLHKSASRSGIKIGLDEILINLGLSHKELAYITDTSRQIVARVLGILKKENIIHFSERKPGKILIRDIEALAY